MDKTFKNQRLILKAKIYTQNVAEWNGKSEMLQDEISLLKRKNRLLLHC